MSTPQTPRPLPSQPYMPSSSVIHHQQHGQNVQPTYPGQPQLYNNRATYQPQTNNVPPHYNQRQQPFVRPSYNGSRPNQPVQQIPNRIDVSSNIFSTIFTTIVLKFAFS